MFKKSGNPKVESLTKTYTDRSINLAILSSIKVEGEEKLFKCAWCAVETFKYKQRKYCSTECSNSAMAWAYPQKEEGLFFLLHRQDWKCNICQHDYRPLAEEIHREMYKKYEEFGGAHKFGERYDWGLTKRLKRRSPKEHKPEVDHIQPISKGGQSLGLDNHQAICYTCHKAKTSKDNSGPRKKACPACTGTGTIHQNCILR